MRGSLGDPEETARPACDGVLRPSLLLLVGLHAYAERKCTSAGRDVREELKAATQPSA
jgi:hypothetical protein